MSMAAVAVAGIAAGAAGTVYSANKNAQASKRASDANTALWREQNEDNDKEYADWKKSIWGDDQESTRQAIMDMQDSLATAYSGYGDNVGAAIDQYGSAMTGSSDYLNGLYSGSNLGGRLGNLQATLDARTEGVQALRDSYANAYQQQQAQRRAANLSQGFYGGGSYADRLARGDLITNQTAIANAANAAKLQNAQDIFNLTESDNTNRLNNLATGYSLASAGAGLQQAKTAAYATEKTAPLTATLNNLSQYASITPYQNNNTTAPTVSYQANTGVGDALSGVGASLTAYGMSKMNQANTNANLQKIINSLGTSSTTSTYLTPNAPSYTAGAGSGLLVN